MNNSKKLDGYEDARDLFGKVNQRIGGIREGTPPKMLLDAHGLHFNTGCIHSMDDPDRVNLLVNAAEKKLVLLPGDWIKSTRGIATFVRKPLIKAVSEMAGVVLTVREPSFASYTYSYDGVYDLKLKAIFFDLTQGTLLSVIK